MAKSNPSAAARKAPKHNKPHHDFPLGVHPSGRWCKRVRGVLRYFGKILKDYYDSCERMIVVLGRNAVVEEIRGDDLLRLRESLAKCRDSGGNRRQDYGRRFGSGHP